MGQTTSDLNKDVRKRPSLLYRWLETVVLPRNDATTHTHLCNLSDTKLSHFCAVVNKGRTCRGSRSVIGSVQQSAPLPWPHVAHYVVLRCHFYNIFSNIACMLFRHAHTQTHTHKKEDCSSAADFACSHLGVAAALGCVQLTQRAHSNGQLVIEGQ